MRGKTKGLLAAILLLVLVCVVALVACTCGTDTLQQDTTVDNLPPIDTESKKSWSATEEKGIVEIGYGSGDDFPQYAALHLESGYLRLNYGPSSGWGTSVILLPSFWESGTYYQGAPIDYAMTTEGQNFVISISATVSSLNVQGKVTITPPGRNSISATVSMNVDGDILLDNRPGEAFKLVMLSSMHVAPDKWDAQSAYVDVLSFQIPTNGWIIKPPTAGSVFGLKGGTSTWKENAPTIEVRLDMSRQIAGWVTLTDNPNTDNVGLWAASDEVVRSWEYTIVVKP